MSLLAKNLLSYLCDERITFQYYGPEFEYICAVQKLPDFQNLQAGYLYLTSDASLTARFRETGYCVLLTEPDLYPRVFDLCSRYLVRRSQKETLLLQFYEELISSPAYNSLLNLCSLILDNNPVVLLNTKFIPRMCSDTFDLVTDDSFTETLKHAVSANREDTSLTEIAASSVCPVRRWVRKIERQNPKKTEYLCVLERHTFVNRAEALHDIHMICNALAGYSGFIALRSNVPDIKLHDLILSLLSAVPHSPSSMRLKLSEAGFREHDQYYVFAIDTQNKSQFSPDYARLRTLLNTEELYRYKNYIVAIPGYRYFEQPSPSLLHTLADYLKPYNMPAGVSNGFSDITMLSHFFNQSVKAIELNKYYQYRFRIASYADFLVTHLLEIVSKSSNARLLNFCHPTLLYIMEYDRKNDTDYLNTLSAYILSNRSIKLSAQALYIHTNTMYGRIQKIKNTFRLDLDDTHLIAQLYISFHILGILRLTDAEIWARIYLPESSPEK